VDLLMQAYTYAANQPEALLKALWEHLDLVGAPLGIALIVGLPLGFFSSRSQSAALLLNGLNLLRVIPSLALLFVMIPILGLSFQAAAIALTVLALPPILINTHVGFREINPALREAAAGMGMTPVQILRQVEIPLALPVIVAGIKTATVEVIASATLAAFIGAGGLGRFIILGFSLYENAVLLVGAIPVALLALVAELGLSRLQEMIEPPQL